MAKVMIVGAGGVGGVVAHKCAQVPEVFDEIVLASRTESKCQAIAEQIDRPIGTAAVDADDVPQMVALIEREQPGLLINVALPYQDLNLMQACLETGIHYLDTANYEPPDTAKFEYHWQWAYQERFREKGLMALLGCGFDPGVTNIFTAHARKHHFDRIDLLDIIDCNAGDHGLPFATNFNPEINIREVSARGRFWEAGQWQETDPLSVRHVFDFPEGIGEMPMYLLYHEELESIITHFPEIRRARFWMTFSDNYLKHLDVLQNVGLTGIEPIDFQGQQIVPLQFLKALLPDPSTLGPLTKGPHLHWLCGPRPAGWPRQDVLHLQHLRSPGLLRGSAVAGHLLHHRGAGDDRCEDDARGALDAARRLERRAARPRSVHGRSESLRFALDRELSGFREPRLMAGRERAGNGWMYTSRRRARQ